MSDPEERVELLRTGDPLRAEMLRELLHGEGIAVATPGLEHRAMLGVIGGHVQIVIQVPRGDLERARALIDVLDAAPLAGLEVGDDDDAREEQVVGYRTSARGASTLGGKRGRVALVASLVLPGGGHVYVSQWRSAAVIVLTEVAALVFALQGMPLAILLLLLAVVADIAGGTWHCARLASDAPPRGGVRRFAPELAALVATVWIALQMGPGAAWLAGPRSTQICTWAAECGDADRRRCLWDASTSRFEETIPRSCETCLREAEECDDANECDSCWEP